MAAEHFSTIPCKVYTAHKVQANHIFCNICPCVNNTVSTRFEDLRTFLYVYMRVVNVFVFYELWVNVLMAIFFFSFFALWRIVRTLSFG